MFFFRILVQDHTKDHSHIGKDYQILIYHLKKVVPEKKHQFHLDVFPEMLTFSIDIILSLDGV